MIRPTFSRLLCRVAAISLWAAGGALPGADQAEMNVQLPPFVVSQLPEGLPWQYARVADLEVLTLCHWQMTYDYIEALLRGRGFFPEAIWSKWSTPHEVVLFAEKPKGSSLETAHVQNSNDRWSRGTLSYLGTICSADGDTSVIAVNLYDFRKWPLSGPDLARHSLRFVAPALPEWLYEGLLGEHGLYQDEAVYRQKDAIQLPAILWGSEEETAALRDKRYVEPKLIPLDHFFTEPPPDARVDPVGWQKWRSQAGLFVRWRLYGQKRKDHDPEAFWRFALLAWRQPVTEALFKESFKLSYRQAERRMLNYLPMALASPVDAEMPGVRRPLREMNDFQLRPATEAEVARLKGNFERMEANRLRADHPDLAQQYEEAARRTLRRGLKATGGDPAIRGIFGQLEYDTGHHAEAQPHLEAAVAAGAAGTRALLATAKLRLDDERAKLPADAKLPAVVLERVLAPLFAARQHQPAMVETYRQIAEAWSLSAVAPTRDNLTVLLEGAHFFPRDTTLLLAAAELHQRHGQPEACAALARLGLAAATDTTTRERFTQLMSKGASTP